MKLCCFMFAKIPAVKLAETGYLATMKATDGDGLRARSAAVASRQSREPSANRQQKWTNGGEKFRSNRSGKNTARDRLMKLEKPRLNDLFIPVMLFKHKRPTELSCSGCRLRSCRVCIVSYSFRWRKIYANWYYGIICRPFINFSQLSSC